VQQCLYGRELREKAMKKSLAFCVAATVLSSGLWVGQAKADVAPPPGYIEQCTVAIQQVGGKSCIACPSGRSDMTACEKQYAAQGYVKSCSSYGASVWTEVWCIGKSDAGGVDAGAAEPPTNPVGGCGCRTSTQPSRVAATMMVLLGAAMLIRQRR